MPVSKALENSARDFSLKYSCDFDFATFEERVEEFTFLRPNNGWIDVYKMMFDRMYKKSLEGVAEGAIHNLDAEAMLDDFEYTLIRPFVNEGETEIKHKPYVGMDRLARLEYLDKLTKEAPSNPVALYTERYKCGELSLAQMKAALATGGAEQDRCVEIVGYLQALENVSQGRSLIWKAVHPFKSNAEQRDAALMKKTFIEGIGGREDRYREIAAMAYETFEGYQRVNENLVRSMANAREEMDRKQKMNDAMRESISVEGFDKVAEHALSPRVDRYKTPIRENQI